MYTGLRKTFVNNSFLNKGKILQLIIKMNIMFFTGTFLQIFASILKSLFLFVHKILTIGVKEYFHCVIGATLKIRITEMQTIQVQPSFEVGINNSFQIRS